MGGGCSKEGEFGTRIKKWQWLPQGDEVGRASFLFACRALAGKGPLVGSQARTPVSDDELAIAIAT